MTKTATADLDRTGATTAEGSAEGTAESSAEGTVEWYSVAKGYGFIRSLGDERDIFVHHSALDVPDDLFEGDHVSFEVIEGDKGLQAQNVRRVD